MNSFTSFDGTRIAYYNEGAGPVVILLHGFGLDGLGNFGHFDRSGPMLERTISLFREEMGLAPPMPEPPDEGRPGLITRLLVLGLHQVKPAILAGVGDYILEGAAMELPKNWPIPDHLPKPLTMRAHAEEGANVLDRNEIVRGDLMSAQVILVRATGADPKVLAAVLRGAMAEQVPSEALRKVEVPVLVLNGTADMANQAIRQLLEVLPNTRSATCEGDHGSTPFQPSFQQAVSVFFKEQWRARGVRVGAPVL